MKNVRHILTCLVVGLFAACLMTGCGRKKGPDGKDPDAPPKEPEIELPADDGDLDVPE